ncbi:MAG: hypothetical protein JWN76_1245 [Chitinophagaceae bacterium]|nr:hypothetical protein [Chitinophagaceae bacterium]
MPNSVAKFLPVVYRTSSVIKDFEGFAHDNKNGTVSAYKDSVGVATIGWGTTQYMKGVPVKMGDIITHDQAQQEFDFHVNSIINQIRTKSKVGLSDSQLTALTSLAYNIGEGGLFGSTLWKKLQAGEDKKIVANEFDRWVHAGGKVLDALVKRRAKEKNIFLS